MKKIISILLCALLLSCALGISEESPSAVDMFISGDYSGLFESSTDQMKAALGSKEGIEAVVKQLEAAYGSVNGMERLTEAASGEFLLQYVRCDFERAFITIVVVTDASGAFAGLQVAGIEAKPAEVAENAGAFVEENVILRKGAADETNGLLTLPIGDGSAKFPCAVMLQGSGPSDMHETAFGIRVFERLARALAENGVATLRFDKYTYAHADMCMSPDFTVDNEYLNDAQAAFDLLKNDERIGNVFILGHSQGAVLAPRIAKSAVCDKLAGLVMVAGTPLPMYKIIAYQTLDSIDRADMEEAEKEAYRAAVFAEVDAFENAGKSGADMTKMSAFGMTAHYLWDDASTDPAETLLSLDLPSLIIQAGKDFQVPSEIGSDLWREALVGRNDTDYLDYPNMTHLLFDLDGESTHTTADYMAENDMNPEIARDIAEWILSVK